MYVISIIKQLSNKITLYKSKILPEDSGNLRKSFIVNSAEKYCEVYFVWITE